MRANVREPSRRGCHRRVTARDPAAPVPAARDLTAHDLTARALRERARLDGMGDGDAVRNNEGESRFEIVIDGHLAELVYHRSGHRFALVHTEVPDALGGRGLGGVLVAAAVDYAAAHDLTVVPRCPFARSWLERHPDVAGRVTIDWAEE